MTLKQSSIGSTLLVTLSLCLLAPFAIAKDITNEQRNAYEARKLYNENKSDYENLLQRISQQETRIAEAQEKLNQLKAEEVEAKTALEKSKANLEIKTKVLNDVWDSRN
jgi:septal ring factor EnvC (AmiA/AmiB activator)